MRQFIFASGYGTDPGQVELVHVTQPNGAQAVKEANLVLHRETEDGGDILYPIYNNHLTWTKSATESAKKFKATFECVDSYGEQTIIFIKKGVNFNERNKWSVSVYMKDDATGADIAAKLKKEFDIKPDLKDKFTVEAEGATITVEATNLIKGEGWTILGADGQQDVKPVVLSEGVPAFLDAAYIKDLAAKCIADLGYDSTYVDASVYLLPGSDGIGNPKDVNPTGTEFEMITIRFAEPRQVKTRDEVVNQIIQVCANKNGLTNLVTALVSMSNDTENNVAGIAAGNLEGGPVDGDTDLDDDD